MSTSRGEKAASKKGAIARVSGRRAAVLQQPLQNRVALEEMPAGYPEWLADVKACVRRAQLRAAQAANGELLRFYWDLGRDLSEKITRGGYGAKVVERLAHDLRVDFPQMKGFSPRNLAYMRRFADLWPDPEILQQLLQNLPWAHLCTIMDKAAEHRDWYARATVEYGWSRPILVMQIETGAHRRYGKATTNFERTLPKPLSDLARETLKDPYRFDFTGLSREAEERHVERVLVEHITEFLIELGAGFAYVGRQVRLEVGEREFYLDLLFYHLRLRAYVVIELKAVEFEPEHLGQLGFYLAAVDGQVKRPDDAPSIGLLLCKTKDAVVAEYALKERHGPDWRVGIPARRVAAEGPRGEPAEHRAHRGGAEQASRDAQAREGPRAGGEEPRSSVERILRHRACANAGGELFRIREEAACAEGGAEEEKAMSAAEVCRETSPSPQLVQGVLAQIRGRTVGDLPVQPTRAFDGHWMDERPGPASLPEATC